MNVVDAVERQQMKQELPDVQVGDTVYVHIRIVEGEKERIQIFEGVVLRLHGGGIRRTVTVRKVSFGVGVERIFPLHSPRVEKIEIIKRAKVRQAKLYFLRKLRGKAARLKERRMPVESTKKTKTKKRGKAKKAAEKSAAAKS